MLTVISDGEISKFWFEFQKINIIISQNEVSLIFIF